MIDLETARHSLDDRLNQNPHIWQGRPTCSWDGEGWMWSWLRLAKSNPERAEIPDSVFKEVYVRLLPGPADRAAVEVGYRVWDPNRPGAGVSDVTHRMSFSDMSDIPKAVGLRALVNAAVLLTTSAIDRITAVQETRQEQMRAARALLPERSKRQSILRPPTKPLD